MTRLIEERRPRARYDELLPLALAATHPELRVVRPLRGQRLARGAPHRLLAAEVAATSNA